MLPALLAALLGLAGDTQPLEDLIRRTQALATRDVVMPMEEVRLAAQLAELPDKETTISALLSRLFDHGNFHVRCVAINASRRIDRFQHPGLMEALVRKRSDPHPWVRYDAAWALKESKSARPTSSGVSSSSPTTSEWPPRSGKPSAGAIRRFARG